MERMERRCIHCGRVIDNPVGRQEFCSKQCRREYNEAHGPGPAYPSENERAIEAEVEEAEQNGLSYGKNFARRMAKAEGQIHAPAGYTSYYERTRGK